MAEELLNVVQPAIIAIESQVVDTRQDVETLLGRTNALFNRRQTPSSSAPKRTKKRGRKFKEKTDIISVLLNHKFYSKVPNKSTLSMLSSQGLGQKVISVKRNLSNDDLEDVIRSQYPCLNGYPFDLVKSSEGRKLKPIPYFSDVQALKRIIKKGKLYIVPKRNLQLNAINLEDSDEDLPDPKLENDDHGTGTGGLDEQEAGVSGGSDEQVAGVSDNGGQVSGTGTGGSDKQVAGVSDNNTSLSERRLLIQQQDAEYHRSLMIDQLKERTRRQQERERAEMEQLRLQRKRQLPEEPTDEFFLLKFRTTTSCSDVTRRFRPDTEMAVLHDFVGSLEGASKTFQLVLPGHQPISSSQRTGVLKDLGITLPTVVQVQWLNEIRQVSGTGTGGLDEQEAGVGGGSDEQVAGVSDNSVQESDDSSDLPDTEEVHEVDTNLTREERTANHQVQGPSRTSRRAARNAINFIRGTCLAIQDTDESGGDDHEVVFGRNDIFTQGANDVTMPLPQEESPEERQITLLTELSSQIKSDSAAKNMVNVDRDDILDGACRAFSRTRFNQWAPLSVKFSGEQGIDNGGLTRAFLQLAISAIHNSQIFDGENGKKVLNHNYQALEDGLYRNYGKMMAYSLVHGGPAPTFLHPSLYEAIVHGPDSVEPPINCVTDLELRNDLEMILQSESIERFIDKTNKIVEIINIAGCMHLLKFHKKEDLVKKITHFIVLGRCSFALQQLLEGLTMCGVLNTIKTNPQEMRNIFVASSGNVLRADQVEELFEISPDAWSAPGSNKHRDEKRVHGFWRDFLLDLEETEKLEDLLVFVVGLRKIPPLGLHPPPNIKFNHRQEAQHIVVADFPYADTCANTLRLPIATNYASFKTNMLAAINTVTIFTDE